MGRMGDYPAHTLGPPLNDSRIKIITTRSYIIFFKKLKKINYQDDEKWENVQYELLHNGEEWGRKGRNWELNQKRERINGHARP